MNAIQKIYEIGKYAVGVLAIAALYSCTEPVNTSKTPVKPNQEAGQTLDDKVYDLIVEISPTEDILKLKKGEIVVGNSNVKYIEKEKDGSLIFEYVKDIELPFGVDGVKKGHRYKIQKEDYKIISQ